MKLRILGQSDCADEAARWFVRDDGDDHSTDLDTEEFDQWLEHPRNREAFARAHEISALFDKETLASVRLPELEALREEAHRHAQRKPIPYAAVGLAVAASIALLLTFVAPGRFLSGPADTQGESKLADATVPVSHATGDRGEFRTIVGNQRSVVLPDGTRVRLNSNSRIEVAYLPNRRVVHLLAGEALFDVTHNPARPFSVVARGRQVTALGTMFDVKMARDTVEVTLVRGKVRIDNAGKELTTPPLAILQPGQQFVAAGALMPVVRNVDIQRQLMWRQSLVEFNDVPLADAVNEMNRYLPGSLVIADPGTGDLRISGTFRVNDTQAFANAVAAMLPVTASKQDGQTVIKKVSIRPYDQSGEARRSATQ